ncbi:hypothetical protein GCM10007421_17020 [Halopseudomonas oceani]|nr:hypothetical protein GCM10007421_17020 [Halopseudomonas oceani]
MNAALTLSCTGIEHVHETAGAARKYHYMITVRLSAATVAALSNRNLKARLASAINTRDVMLSCIVVDGTDEFHGRLSLGKWQATAACSQRARRGDGD